MSTRPAPADQLEPLVEIDNLARAMMDNGIDSEVIKLYLRGKHHDRNTDRLQKDQAWLITTLA